jgi:hypothetical protein
MLWLLATGNVPSSPIVVTLMMEALRSSAASVITGVTRRHIPEDRTLDSHRRENLKSYIVRVLSFNFKKLTFFSSLCQILILTSFSNFIGFRQCAIFPLRIRVGTAADCGLDNRGSNFESHQNILFSTPYRPTLGPIQRSIDGGGDFH